MIKCFKKVNKLPFGALVVNTILLILFISSATFAHSFQFKSLQQDVSGSFFKPVEITPGKPNAFWGQFGLGSGYGLKSQTKDRRRYLQAELSLHYRKYKSVYSLGSDMLATECHEMSAVWATYGFSRNSRYVDQSFNIGLAVSQWIYHTESELGTISSSTQIGPSLNASLMVHTPHVMGAGIGANFHITRDLCYWGVYFFFALGSWDW